jgi:hypothetical protein
MQIITGRICKLLHDSAGAVNGLSLDTGLEVRFPPDRAARVLAVVTAGSRVEIYARMREGLGADTWADATLVTNLDSRQYIDLSIAPTPHSPEVSSYVYAPSRKLTPLVPALETGLQLQPIATASDVAHEIEQARERLHRIHTILLYLKMTNQKNSGLSEYLDEAEHTLVQALSRYEARDFEAAREYVAASSDLSDLVEILISRFFGVNTSHWKFVSPASEHVHGRHDRESAQQRLDRVERLLARVQWVTENGTLSSEDRTQVERFSSWGNRLCQWARRLLDAGAMEDAVEFAQAAGAAIGSAQHLCRECYVTRRVRLQPLSTSN